MKYLSYSLLISFMVFGCIPSQGGDKSQKATKLKDTLFTLADAESIVGEPVRITESKTTSEGGHTVYRSAYVATGEDTKTGRLGNVYYFAEQYNDAAAAHKTYADIKAANEKNGIKTLNNLGDEAYFHTDNENFYYIMVRKGNKGFRIK